MTAILVTPRVICKPKRHAGVMHAVSLCTTKTITLPKLLLMDGRLLLLGSKGRLVVGLLHTRLSHRVGKVSHGLVKLLVVCREQESDEERGAGKSDIGPDEVRVLDRIGAGEPNGGTNGRVEQADTVNETLHSSRSIGVGNLVRGDHDKDFSDGRDTVVSTTRVLIESGDSPIKDDLPPDGDRRDFVTGRSVVTTWTGLVHSPLHDGTGNHVDGCELESNEHSSHRLERVANLLEEGVDSPSLSRQHESSRQRVNVQ